MSLVPVGASVLLVLYHASVTTRANDVTSAAAVASYLEVTSEFQLRRTMAHYFSDMDSAIHVGQARHQIARRAILKLSRNSFSKLG